MDGLVLINNSGLEISTIEELMLYVVDNYGGGDLSSDVESDFYSILLSEDIIEDEDYRLETLEEGFYLLKNLEPGYWFKERY